MVEVPAASADITPELFTVAAVVLALLHTPPVVVLVKVVVRPTQTACVPVKAETTGKALTVT
jgi:hypothetical protein